MAYQLRFESNAFEADSMIGKALDGLMTFSRNAQRMAGAKVRADEVNRLMTLRGVCQRTFEGAMDWADKDFDQQMASEKWPLTEGWPNTTRRRNGEVVSSPRDIIDTGALLQSKRRDPTPMHLPANSRTGDWRNAGWIFFPTIGRCLIPAARDSICSWCQPPSICTAKCTGPESKQEYPFIWKNRRPSITANWRK